MGRATTNNPCILWDVDRYVYGEASNPLTSPSRRTIVEEYCKYLEKAVLSVKEASNEPSLSQAVFNENPSPTTSSPLCLVFV